MQSARSKRSLRSIPLIVPLSFLENQPHFFSHATRPRFDPNGRENAVDLSRFIWQNSTNILFFNRFPNILTAAATCSRRFGFGVRSRCGWCFRSRLLRSVSCPLWNVHKKCKNPTSQSFTSRYILYEKQGPERNSYAYGLLRQERHADRWVTVAITAPFSNNKPSLMQFAAHCTESQLNSIHLLDALHDFMVGINI